MLLEWTCDALHDIILEPVFRCLCSIVLIFNWWMLKIWSPNRHWTVPSMKWISLYHFYAAYMSWISGGLFVKKHLTQGTLSWRCFSRVWQFLQIFRGRQSLSQTIGSLTLPGSLTLWRNSRHVVLKLMPQMKSLSSRESWHRCMMFFASYLIVLQLASLSWSDKTKIWTLRLFVHRRFNIQQI